MSVYVECADCGAGFETGLGDSRTTCRDCRERDRRLANGGRSLSSRERAAAAMLFDSVVTADGRVVPTNARVGALVCGGDRAADFEGDEFGVFAVADVGGDAR